MRIARFLDPQDRICFGIPTGSRSAELLTGDLYAGLRPSGETLMVSKWLAPLDPLNIFCIGLNYRGHAAETGASIPEHPIIFMKPTSSVTGPDDPILLPASCAQGPEVDYEAELAVVIGKRAKNVPVAAALETVLGYTVANDISARRWQKYDGGGQWVRGKSFDTFCPLGPVLVTAEEIPDPQALTIGCELNGQQLQSGFTGDMIFSVAELISRLSRDTTLLPGTLILTGTPSGVGFTRNPPVFLSPGDRIRVSIEGIGILENRICAP
jgi:2-keto-4-pentenoate hydratase/2-oxohepta-3-ene-1,7-dioic acid hydratase in catechol pathway